MSENTQITMTLTVIGLILSHIIIYNITIWNGNVTIGEQFILNHATYKCVKTNELITGDIKK